MALLPFKHRSFSFLYTKLKLLFTVKLTADLYWELLYSSCTNRLKNYNLMSITRYCSLSRGVNHRIAPMMSFLHICDCVTVTLARLTLYELNLIPHKQNLYLQYNWLSMWHTKILNHNQSWHQRWKTKCQPSYRRLEQLSLCQYSLGAV